MSNQPMHDQTEEAALTSGMEFKRELHSHVNREDELCAVMVSQNSDAISPSHNTTFSVKNQSSSDMKNNSNESVLDPSAFLTSLNPLLPSSDLSNAMPSYDAPRDHETFKPNPAQASAFELIPSTSYSNIQSLPTHEVPPTTIDSPPSFAESYTNLTSWTTKLMAQGIDQIPLPGNESLPIPLAGANHKPSIPASSAPFYLMPDPAKVNITPPFTKIGPVTLAPGVVPVGTSHVDSSAGSSSSLDLSASPKSKLKATLKKEHRFKKTADALHKSGLWEVAMKTGNLIKRNRELQKELEQFRADALLFLKSVIKNPQNRDFIKNVLSNSLSASGTHQKKASVMSIVVSAAAAVSVKLKTSPSTHDSGISSSSSCGSQSDHSMSNFLYTKSNSSTPGQSGPMDTE